MSFDFIGLNFLGHSCYAAFNIALFWIPVIQVKKKFLITVWNNYLSIYLKHEYFKQHPRGVNPVLLNDVLFSMHAVLLTFTTIIQCFIYRKPGHNLSKISMGILALLVAFLIISGIICAVSSVLSNLEYVYFFSYVKLAITICKYIPQV